MFAEQLGMQAPVRQLSIEALTDRQLIGTGHQGSVGAARDDREATAQGREWTYRLQRTYRALQSSGRVLDAPAGSHAQPGIEFIQTLRMLLQADARVGLLQPVFEAGQTGALVRERAARGGRETMLQL